MWLFIQTHWGILAAIFVILCAVTGMSALTRFIEAIDKKLIIEAKPRAAAWVDGKDDVKDEGGVEQELSLFVPSCLG
jgi:hypothetical protein